MRSFPSPAENILGEVGAGLGSPWHSSPRQHFIRWELCSPTAYGISVTKCKEHWAGSSNRCFDCFIILFIHASVQQILLRICDMSVTGLLRCECGLEYFNPHSDINRNLRESLRLLLRWLTQPSVVISPAPAFSDTFYGRIAWRVLCRNKRARQLWGVRVLLAFLE